MPSLSTPSTRAAARRSAPCSARRGVATCTRKRSTCATRETRSGRVAGSSVTAPSRFARRTTFRDEDCDMNISTVSSIVPTRYWHRLEDGAVQCDLCPRFCKLHEGQPGLCFVRARQNDQVVLTTYGRSSGFCVDPIEKKPLNHFLPGSPVLSFGTAGCNLACRFCQNWDISKSREVDTLADRASPETIARAASELGCRSVAFTYNDPVIFLEYAIDVAQACHDHGLKTVAVTAGYMCAEPRTEFYRFIDAANVDLKGF